MGISFPGVTDSSCRAFAAKQCGRRSWISPQKSAQCTLRESTTCSTLLWPLISPARWRPDLWLFASCVSNESDSNLYPHHYQHFEFDTIHQILWAFDFPSETAAAAHGHPWEHDRRDLPVDVAGPQASEPGHCGVHGQADRHVPRWETCLKDLIFWVTFRNPHETRHTPKPRVGFVIVMGFLKIPSGFQALRGL